MKVIFGLQYLSLIITVRPNGPRFAMSRFYKWKRVWCQSFFLIDEMVFLPCQGQAEAGSLTGSAKTKPQTGDEIYLNPSQPVTIQWLEQWLLS